MKHSKHKFNLMICREEYSLKKSTTTKLEELLNELEQENNRYVIDLQSFENQTDCMLDIIVTPFLHIISISKKT